MKRLVQSVLFVGILGLLGYVAYSQFGFYSIPPMGAIPDGGTVIVRRLPSEPFWNSVDVPALRANGEVTLLTRGLGIQESPIKRVVLRLSYWQFAYDRSVTDARRYYLQHPSAPLALSTPMMVSHTEDSLVSPDDFEIVSYTMEWEGSWLMLYGEIKNNATVDAGVELQLLVRDADGKVIDSKQFWPASISNIAPGASYGLKTYATQKTNGASLELTILNAKQW